MNRFSEAINSIYTTSIARRLRIIKLSRELGITPYMFADRVYFDVLIVDDGIVAAIDFMSRTPKF